MTSTGPASGPSTNRTTTLTRRGWSLTGAAFGLILGSFLLGTLEMLVVGIAALGTGARGRVLAALPAAARARGQPASASRPPPRGLRGAHRPAGREPRRSRHAAAVRHRLVRRGPARRALPRAPARRRCAPPAPRTGSRPAAAAATGSARSSIGGDRPVRPGAPQRAERGRGRARGAAPRARDRRARRRRQPHQRRARGHRVRARWSATSATSSSPCASTSSATTCAASTGGRPRAPASS